MHVVLINGSPRAGNTAAVLDKIGAELSALGCTVELIHLHRHAIKPCLGCFKCVTDGEQACPLSDEVNAIWARVLAADGLVLGAPVYALGVSGIMKNFMDRVAWNAHRPRMFNKPALLVSTTAGMGTEKVLSQLSWFTIAGLKIVGRQGFLCYPTGRDRPQVAQRKAKTIKRLAERLLSAMWRRPGQPSWMQILQFHGLRLNADFGRAVYRADNEWFRTREYHVPARVSRPKRLFARFFFWMGTKALQATIEREELDKTI